MINRFENLTYTQLKAVVDREEKDLEQFRKANEPAITAYLTQVDQLRDLRNLLNKKMLQNG